MLNSLEKYYPHSDKCECKQIWDQSDLWEKEWFISALLKNRECIKKHAWEKHVQLLIVKCITNMNHTWVMKNIWNLLSEKEQKTYYQIMIIKYAKDGSNWDLVSKYIKSESYNENNEMQHILYYIAKWRKTDIMKFVVEERIWKNSLINTMKKLINECDFENFVWIFGIMVKGKYPSDIFDQILKNLRFDISQLINFNERNFLKWNRKINSINEMSEYVVELNDKMNEIYRLVLEDLEVLYGTNEKIVDFYDNLRLSKRNIIESIDDVDSENIDTLLEDFNNVTSEEFDESGEFDENKIDNE